MTSSEGAGGDGGAGARQPPRALIVTVFGLYVREIGGWVSVSELIRLLAALEVDAPAVRSSVARLKRRGILEAERRDGVAGYALSDYARHLLDVGDRRIFQRAPQDAAGQGGAGQDAAGRGGAGQDAAGRGGAGQRGERWVLAVFSVPESERQQRHLLRGRLSWLGFGTVSAGVWIAPAHIGDDARDLLASEGLDAYVELFSAEYLAFGDPAERVASWWDLGALDALYQEFVATFGPVLARWRTAPGTPQEAFADYVSALTAWRRLPYLDPGLPRRLLPADWAGGPAADIFFGLQALLEEPAHTSATQRA